MSPKSELPTFLSWGIDAVERVGLERVLVAILLYFALGVVYAEGRATHVAVVNQGEILQKQLQAIWGHCVNEADTDVQVARCGPKP